MKKRVLMSLVLLTIGASMVFAQAEILKFTEVSGGYAVAANGSATRGEVVIPSTYNGKPVVAIAANGFYRANIISIAIPDSVTEIGTQAFMHCGMRELAGANIGAGVKTIGSSAFEGCGNLRRVWIRSNVKTIGDSAFKNCNRLERVTFNENGVTIHDNAFPGNLREVYKAQGAAAFDGAGSGNNKRWTKAP